MLAESIWLQCLASPANLAGNKVIEPVEPVTARDAWWELPVPG
jgi:hypothetical protein